MPKAFLCLNYLHRVQDNPLFNFCAKEKLDIIPFVLFTKENLGKLGATEKLWLQHSLESFNHDLDGKLLIIGSKEDFKKLIKTEKPECLLYSFHSETRIGIDFSELVDDFPNLKFHQLQANNIFDFEKIKNKSGKEFKVFTPFYKHCLSQEDEFITNHLGKQISNDIKSHINIVKLDSPSSIADLNLLASNQTWNKAWQEKILGYWDISEQAARKKLAEFSERAVNEYPETRDLPALSATSKLSAYLHFGMISPFRTWFDIKQTKHAMKEVYLRQLCWREFAQYILYHFPKSYRENWNNKFDNFPWQENDKALEAWKKGLTGYPIVDAGMRELWETGWMHNRVRMIVGSFLVKDLMIHWCEGAKWFEETLVDADLANNSMGWQWVAGSGVDASPYFRIFNPMTQSEKFDKEAQYIRRWLPELNGLDNKWIHRPFEAPAVVLEAAGVELGKTYPEPLVNHDQARKEALAAFKTLKK